MADARAKCSDRDLVGAALGVTRGAFGVLASRHRKLAFGVARRLLGNAQAAEDAVQEAVVVALVSLARLRKPDRFGAWLCGITVNIARRWIRDQQRLSPTPVSLAAEHIPDNGVEPEEQAVLDDLADRVRSAVAVLVRVRRRGDNLRLGVCRRLRSCEPAYTSRESGLPGGARLCRGDRISR